MKRQQETNNLLEAIIASVSQTQRQKLPITANEEVFVFPHLPKASSPVYGLSAKAPLDELYELVKEERTALLVSTSDPTYSIRSFMNLLWSGATEYIATISPLGKDDSFNKKLLRLGGYDIGDGSSTTRLGRSMELNPLVPTGYEIKSSQFGRGVSAQAIQRRQENMYEIGGIRIVDSTLGTDAYVGPGTSLHNCCVGPKATIIESDITDKVVPPNSTITNGKVRRTRNIDELRDRVQYEVDKNLGGSPKLTPSIL